MKRHDTWSFFFSSSLSLPLIFSLFLSHSLANISTWFSREWKKYSSVEKTWWFSTLMEWERRNKILKKLFINLFTNCNQVYEWTFLKVYPTSLILSSLSFRFFLSFSNFIPSLSFSSTQLLVAAKKDWWMMRLVMMLTKLVWRGGGGDDDQQKQKFTRGMQKGGNGWRGMGTSSSPEKWWRERESLKYFTHKNLRLKFFLSLS